jgi:hypothetical protein
VDPVEFAELRRRLLFLEHDIMKHWDDSQP